MTFDPPSAPSRRSLAAYLVLLAVGYFVAGKLGLMLAVGNASVSAVWPPTGIAIAALLLAGSELWPAVFVGAFAVNLTTTWDVGSSLGIAGGNTLEVLVGAFLATRFAGGRRALDRPQDVLAFALFSGFLAATIAATVGTTTLVLAHLASPSQFVTLWGPWWLGDAIGAIEFGPLLLAIAQRWRDVPPVGARPGWPEGLVVGLTTATLAILVFARAPTGFLGGYPLIFLVLPPTIWASMRFGPLGATGSATTVSVVAILSTIAGLGPFATLPDGVDLLALRIFVGSLVLTALFVSADLMQHRRFELELNHTRKELQRMLQERTRELDAAKSLAKVGTWSYDVASEKVVWSEEVYQLLGYGTARFPVVLDRALERIDPDDRRAILQDLRGGIHSPDPRRHEFAERKVQVELPDGERRTLLSRLEIAGIEGGRTTRLSGTVQDITERQRIEDELERLRTPEERSPEGGGFGLWMVPWQRATRRDGPRDGESGSPSSTTASR